MYVKLIYKYNQTILLSNYLSSNTGAAELSGWVIKKCSINSTETGPDHTAPCNLSNCNKDLKYSAGGFGMDFTRMSLIQSGQFRDPLEGMFPRLSDIKRRNKHFNSIWCLENKKIIQPPLETLVTDLLGNYSCAWQNIFTNWGQIKILPASSLQSFPKHFGKILFVAARALKIIRVGRNIWYLHCGSQFDAIFSQYLWLWKFAQCLQSVPFYLVLICSPVRQQLVLIATFLFVTNLQQNSTKHVGRGPSFINLKLAF